MPKLLLRSACHPTPIINGYLDTSAAMHPKTCRQVGGQAGTYHFPRQPLAPAPVQQSTAGMLLRAGAVVATQPSASALQLATLHLLLLPRPQPQYAPGVADAEPAQQLLEQKAWATMLLWEAAASAVDAPVELRQLQVQLHQAVPQPRMHPVAFPPRSC